MSAHTSARFNSWINQAVKTGQLKTGYKYKRTWISFAVLSRIVSAFLLRAIEQGTLSWDITIAKCLSMVLVASLGAQSGDVCRSGGYTGGQYMQYRHVELHIDSDEPTFANLRAIVTLEFKKGHKTDENVERIRHLSALGSSSHIDPIAWILVHALCHGLVVGTTLQDMLDRAFAREDRKVEWLHPNCPVLACFTQKSGPGLRVDIDQPANPQQLLNSIKQMGTAAQMLGRVYTHALHLGHRRDTALLPADANASMNIEQARQTLSHTGTALNKGVTD